MGADGGQIELLHPIEKGLVKRERVFYEDQSQALSNFIRYLGLTLSIIFSVGAMIGAMITMYAAVANRVAEIGTLRALGYRRSGHSKRLAHQP